jgi:transposase
MLIHSVGIDLGKTTFHLVALGAAGKVLVRKKFTQKQLQAYTANLQISLIGLEACSGAHFLGRALHQGHDVQLIPAQFVKPFVKSNKNDFIDTEAIAEPLNARTCALFRSRRTISWICRQTIECATGSSRGVRQ